MDVASPKRTHDHGGKRSVLSESSATSGRSVSRVTRVTLPVASERHRTCYNLVTSLVEPQEDGDADRHAPGGCFGYTSRRGCRRESDHVRWSRSTATARLADERNEQSQLAAYPPRTPVCPRCFGLLSRSSS